MENQPVNPINNPSSVPVSPPIPTQPVTPPPIASNPQINNLNKPRSFKKLILILILIISIVTIGFLIYKLTLKTPKDLAAKVGSEKITKDEVVKFATDCVVSEKEAVEYLVDEKVLTKWANDEKITIPETPTQTREGSNGATITASQCSTIISKVIILRERLSLENQPYREGKFIIVNFDRYNPKPYLPSTEASTEAGRVKLQTEDKEYADSLINDLYKEITSNKISFEEAMEKVRNDNKLGINSPYSSSVQSGNFDAIDYQKKRGLLKFDDVRKVVDRLEKNQISEPFIQKLDIAIGGNPEYVESRWIILKVEKTEENDRQITLDSIYKKYKAIIYLK